MVALAPIAFADLYPVLDKLLAARDGLTLDNLLDRTEDELVVMVKAINDTNRRKRR